MDYLQLLLIATSIYNAMKQAVSQPTELITLRPSYKGYKLKVTVGVEGKVTGKPKFNALDQLVQIAVIINSLKVATGNEWPQQVIEVRPSVKGVNFYINIEVSK